VKFHVFLTPMHIVEIEADSHVQSCGVHQFITGDQTIAEFQQMIGWMEVKVDLSREKASVTSLTVVSRNTPPSEPAA
jgi:hypothetical protein